MTRKTARLVMVAGFASLLLAVLVIGVTASRPHTDPDTTTSYDPYKLPYDNYTPTARDQAWREARCANNQAEADHFTSLWHGDIHFHVCEGGIIDVKKWFIGPVPSWLLEKD